MQLTLSVTIAGSQQHYKIQPPDWRKWEMDSGREISDAAKSLGMKDLIFLAYNAAKRAGATSLTLDEWADTLEDVESEGGAGDSPKVTS